MIRIRSSQALQRAGQALVLALIALLAGCGSLPQQAEREEHHAYRDTGNTRLGTQLAGEIARHAPDSGIMLLGDGISALTARLTLAEIAERGIDAQYYILENDQSGRRFLHSLLAAADRGVRVRLLLDDINLGDADPAVAALDSHPNVSVRVFNPFARDAPRVTQLVGKASTISRRMHNKSFTVDNQVSIVGGRNIGDHYFDVQEAFVFDDLDVLLAGPVVNQVSSAFDRYWNHDLAYSVTTLVPDSGTPEALEKLRAAIEETIEEESATAVSRRLEESPLRAEILAGETPFHWAPARIIVDHPEKLAASRDATGYHLASDLAATFGQVQDRLTIISPYFVPGEEGVELARDLAGRGIHIRVLTNALSSTDVPAVHAGYAPYREDLLAAGVELFELNSTHIQSQPIRQSLTGFSSLASLHAKSFIFDRDTVFIGSLNLDPRSITENTEIGALIESPKIATEMVNWFDSNVDRMAYRLVLETQENGSPKIHWYGLEDGRQVEYDHDPKTSAWLRTGVWFLGLLPVEPLL